MGNGENLSSKQPNKNQHDDFNWNTAKKEISKSKIVKRRWSFQNKEAQVLKLYEQTDFLIVKKEKTPRGLTMYGGGGVNTTSNAIFLCVRWPQGDDGDFSHHQS